MHKPDYRDTDATMIENAGLDPMRGAIETSGGGRIVVTPKKGRSRLVVRSAWMSPLRWSTEEPRLRTN